jgi:RES domain-containing protein
MEYFRLYEKQAGRTPLGYGVGSGRWNEKKTPMIYASSSVALTMVEHFSISGYKVSNTKFELATLEIDYDIPYIEEKDLPTNWNLRFHKRDTQEFGTTWAGAKEFLCLKVPSARIPISIYPEEHNLLINPLHSDFGTSVKVVLIEEILFNLNKQKSK